MKWTRPEIRITPLAVALALLLLSLYGVWFQTNNLWSDFGLFLVACWNCTVSTSDTGYLERNKQSRLILISLALSVAVAVALGMVLKVNVLSCVLIGLIFAPWMPALVYIARQETKKRSSASYVTGPLMVLILNASFFRAALPLLITCAFVTLMYALKAIPIRPVDITNPIALDSASS
jgi:F0F1-type ATP synthase assembly protein I